MVCVCACGACSMACLLPQVSLMVLPGKARSSLLPLPHTPQPWNGCAGGCCQRLCRQRCLCQRAKYASAATSPLRLQPCPQLPARALSRHPAAATDPLHDCGACRGLAVPPGTGVMAPEVCAVLLYVYACNTGFALGMHSCRCVSQ